MKLKNSFSHSLQFFNLRLPVFIMVMWLTFFVEMKAQDSLVYESESLKIVRLTEHTYRHITYLSTEDFGNVSCNGMIVIDSGEALVFDTPTDDAGSKELIEWTEGNTDAKVVGVVVTHFHNDCLGGLGDFHQRGIPSYAHMRTIALASDQGLIIPQVSFRKKLKIQVGELKVENRFFGEGHTLDNIVSYVPADQVLFGGCMIKSVSAGKGYLGDANVEAWPTTVMNLKKKYPSLELVIPGHGSPGGTELLDYTIKLFSK
ncbi:subclass B1 metallo-beta-lactamase [Roseivirga sp.]|uniref:subclass B1 metallo-beta-lactamase n=1 Tax=Roseivirga sp. TaxID=1964215 RepID=UPI003B5165EE